MKGEIFNIFEDFVADNLGQQAYEQAYEKACPHLATKEPFIGPGTYPDTDFMALVEATCRVAALEQEQAAEAFGKYCFPKLLRKLPYLVEQYKTPVELIMAVEPIIHVEVRKLYKNTELPRFVYLHHTEESLEMIYYSPRRLYHFLEGLIQGVAQFYGTTVEVMRELCEYEGQEACRFTLVFGA